MPNPALDNCRPGIPGIPNPPPAEPTPLVPGSNSSPLVPYQQLDTIRPSSIALQALLYIFDVNELGSLVIPRRESIKNTHSSGITTTPLRKLFPSRHSNVLGIRSSSTLATLTPQTLWMIRLTVVQIALLVLRYFRTDNPPGKSLVIFRVTLRLLLQQKRCRHANDGHIT
jgi:hypothetical protein